MTDHPTLQSLQQALDAAERRAEALQSSLDATRGMTDAISEAIYVQDAEGRFLEVNEGAVRMYGYPKSFFVGKTPEALSAPGRNDFGQLAQAFGRALQGEPQQFEYWGLRSDGSSFPKNVRLYPGTHLGQQVVFAVAQDISGQKRAEQIRDATYRISEAALGSRNLPALYQSVHGILRTLLPAENCCVALHDPATDSITWPYWSDEVDAAPAPRRFGRGLTEYVIRTGQPQLLDETHMASLAAAGEIEFLGTESLAWMGVPLRNEHRVFGALIIQSYEGGHRYQAGDLEILAFVSAQIAMAIERKSAEEKLSYASAAVDGAWDSMFWVNQEGRFEAVNRAACLDLGYTQKEFLDMVVADIDASVTPELWASIWQGIRSGAANIRETTQRRKDGTFRPAELSRVMVSLEGRELLFVSARDISVRKKAEAALLASEAKFSRAFHASPDAINITRLDDSTYLDVSEGFEKLCGWTRQEAIGRTALGMNIWVNPQDRQQVIDLIRTQGEFTGHEIQFRRKDGSILTGLMSGKIMEVDGISCLLSVTRDITERKTAEAALWAAEQRLRAVLSNSQAVIYQLDPEGRFQLSEGLGLSNLGLRPGEAVGMSALELYQGDLETTDQIRRALAGAASRQITHAGGRVFDNILTPVFDEQGALESVIGIALDVTERQQAEEALRAERGLFVGGPVMVIRWQATPPWLVDYISPNVQKLLGYAPEDLTSGRVLFDSLVHPEDRDRIHQEAEELRLKGFGQFEQQYRMRNAAGDYRWFHDFTTPASSDSNTPYFLGYMLDITDRLQAEDALRQSQKLESLGILAGGIAHDFNNLLAVVLGNLNLAQMHLPEHAQAQPYLAKMEATVLRATELTKQMLAYSGRGHFVVEPQNLNEVVREVTHLLEVSISKKIGLRFDLAPHLPAIQADAGQIQQVVMNLVTNASDAIGDHDGYIHLSTSLKVYDERELRSVYRTETLKPGRYVLLEVTDTGIGMSPEVMARIFDPFFTTKSTGRGLGLSAMLGILRGHGAGLHIASQEGYGSSFQICFPASEERTPAAIPPTEANTSKPLHGRILLVDDEDLILETIGSALRILGLEVTTAKDGLEALERFRAERPDLVLMDITMPRMDGREAFRAMYDLDPAIPVILSSGYALGESIGNLPGAGPTGFMQKPYQVKELRQLLQRVLGE